MDKVFDLVVIGAGPGGISAAVEAGIAGVDNNKIVILEKSDAHNETVRKFYKHGKRVDVDWNGIKAEFHGHLTFEQGSKEEYIKQFDDIIEKYNLRVVYNHHVYAVKKNDDGIFEISADKELGIIRAKKVVIAIGVMGKPNKPGYPFPPKIRPRLNFNLDKVQPGEKVLVVGGGDTAGEYAYGLVDMDLGCEVHLNYRKPEITRMNPTNKEIVERYIAEGKLKSKLGVDIENVEIGSDDVTPPRVKVNFKDGTSEEYDRVVYALGGTTPTEFLQNCGIEMKDKWTAEHNPETFETNVEGMYVVGDVVEGAQSIAVAINHGYYAALDLAKKL